MNIRLKHSRGLRSLLRKTSVLMSLFVFCASTSQAQQFEDAASIEYGRFDFTPTVDLGFRYDDNLLKTNANKSSSWSYWISPQLNLRTSKDNSDLGIAYRLRRENFFSSSADNYTDHFFIVDLDTEFDARNRLQASLEFEDGHDERGARFSIGRGQTLARPDQYKQVEFDALYSYGAFNATGRLELNLNIVDLNYDIDDIDNYLARDRTINTIGGTFLYRIGPVTDLTVDVIHSRVAYKFDLELGNPLDSRVNQFLLGVKWEATAKTSGFIKVGYEQKNFLSSSRSDFSGFDWSAGVVWEPTTYATIEFISASNTNETNGEGNFIRGRDYSVEWRHEWLERLRSRVGVSWNNNRYEGQLIGGLDIRSDDNASFNAALYYQFRRWLNFELGYRYSERKSNRSQIDFNRNQFWLNALVTL